MGFTTLRRSSQSAVMVVTGLAMMLALVAIVGWTLLDARQATRRQAVEAQGNVSLGLERDIRRAVEVLDLSLRSVAAGMEMPGIGSMDPGLRRAILFDGAINAEGFGGAFVINAAGDVIYDSFGGSPHGVNVLDRSYFQAHRDNPDLGLVITPPIRSRIDGSEVLGLARRLNHPDGSFAGVVVGTLRLDYLQALAGSIKLGEHGIFSLVAMDGTLIAHVPYVQQDIGRTIRNPGYFRQIQQSAAGVVEAQSVLDGMTRLYSYRQVGDLPLYVAIGQATTEIYAEWVHKSLVLAGVLAVLLAVGVWLAMALRRELLRRSRAERAAYRSERKHSGALARLNALFQNSGDSMLVAHARADGAFVYEAVNPVWERLSGVPASAALGRTPDECLPADLADRVLAGWRECLSTLGPASYAFATQPDGILREWEATSVPVLGENGEVDRLVVVARDVTERKAAETRMAALNLELAAQASTDGLTGLSNRRQLDKAIDQEWRRAAREEIPLSMLLIDLDRFKLYNDRYGHQEGDACLRAAAAAVAEFARRPGDTAARYGGEELALLLPKVDAAQAAVLAERVRAAIEAIGFPHAGNVPYGVVTASIGVATVKPFASSNVAMADQLIAAADAALYEAKHTGRNRVVGPLPIDGRPDLGHLLIA